MKRSVLLSLSIILTISLSACSDNDDSPQEGGNIDKTTYCKSAYEAGAYNTFFKPENGWVGDPIPFSDNGIFYIFYLQDWRRDFPYLHPWYMASSGDLSSFSYQGEIIPCGALKDQDVALGTGGVIKSRENGHYYAFYTGHQWTPEPGMPIQGVMLTTSPDMKTWTKKKDFLLFISGPGYNIDEFRDPHVYYDEESAQYKMIVSANKDGKAALALLTSKDLLNWTQQEPFYTDKSVSMLECADVYKEGDFWYLVYSNVEDRKVHYKYSRSQNGPWLSATNSALDGIGFYAGKTANNGTGRYIFGWCPTRMGSTGREDEWGGSLIYHRLVQQPDGTLKVAMPEIFKTKFNKEIKTEDISKEGTTTLQGNSYILTGQAEVVFPRITKASRIAATITSTENDDIFGFTFGACGNRDEMYSMRFDQANKKLAMYKQTLTENTKVSEIPLVVNSDKKYDVQIVIEKSVCVMYVNNEIAFTNRIDRISQNPWMIFSEKGNEITFSDIKQFNNQ